MDEKRLGHILELSRVIEIQEKFLGWKELYLLKVLTEHLLTKVPESLLEHIADIYSTFFRCVVSHDIFYQRSGMARAALTNVIFILDRIAGYEAHGSNASNLPAPFVLEDRIG